jgi:hypothetical protein
MRLQVLLLLLFLSIWGCAKGYKEGEPLTGEALVLAQKATELARNVEEINEDAPSSLGEPWKGLVENVKLFDNSCQRHSCNSLEARNDFNHLRYYAVQLDSIITQQAYSALYPKWREVREKYVDPIGKELGYRIE